MAKKTLLRLVQEVGRAIGSDEIDQLDENTETADIVALLETTYEYILDRFNWEFTRNQLRTLDEREVGDLDVSRLPLPTDVQGLTGTEMVVRYRDPTDGQTQRFKDLNYLPPAEFLRRSQGLNENDANVTSVTTSTGVVLLVRTNAAPSNYTSFDEEHIWFDSYDITRGNGNLGTDTVIIANVDPVMDWTDPTAFLPIPERMEKLVMYETIKIAAVQLRQTADPEATQRARALQNSLKELEPRVKRDTESVDYGRRSGRSFRR